MTETQTLKESLQAQFVGKSLHDVGTPSVVLDLAKIEANCNLMLSAVEKLGLGWRAHIKTHKTTELTRLQVGDKSTSPVNIIVSTVLEAENIVPLLKEYQNAGRKVNVLYAFPLLGSYIDRLSRVASSLGPRSLSILIDHADQLPHLPVLAAKSGSGNQPQPRPRPPQVFLKVDMGYHRAGIPPTTPECAHLIEGLLRAEAAGSCDFVGLYCHAGHSYSTREDWEALGLLGQEIAVLQGVGRAVNAARRSLSLPSPSSSSPFPTDAAGKRPPLVLSVGATPTTTSIQHPGFYSDDTETDTDAAASVPGALKNVMRELKDDGFALEMHAGVYPVLDLQQLATHSRDAARHLAADAIAISVLAEVASVYPGRGPGSQAGEGLVNVGTLGLGREPCQDGSEYGGWGIVTPWNGSGSAAPGVGFPGSWDKEGGGGDDGDGDGKGKGASSSSSSSSSWHVGKISQEHGILRSVGDAAKTKPLRVGQRVRIWPNHACVTGTGYPWYLVVDSRNTGREDEVVDVWPRWRGW